MGYRLHADSVIKDIGLQIKDNVRLASNNNLHSTRSILQDIRSQGGYDCRSTGGVRYGRRRAGGV